MPISKRFVLPRLASSHLTCQYALSLLIRKQLTQITDNVLGGPFKQRLMGHSQAFAHSLFHGFDVKDAASQDFLESLVVDDRAPATEIRELAHISLMSGLEQWDSLFERASFLRDGLTNVTDSGTDLLPFLALALAERSTENSSGTTRRRLGAALSTAKPTRKLQRQRSCSHFWTQTKVTPPSSKAPERIDTPVPRIRGRTGAKPGHQRGSLTRDESLAAKDDGFRTPAVDNRKEVGGISWSDGALVAENVALGDTSQSDMTAERSKASTPFGAKHRTARSTSTFFTSSPSSDVKTAYDEAQSPYSVSASTPSQKRSRHPRPPRGTVSALPFPPLSAPSFGLAQETLAHDPLRLIVAVNFLIRTPGRISMPVFRQVMERFPTPEALVEANPADLIDLTHHLGLSSRRAATIQKLATGWLENPPSRLKRYGVKGYPPGLLATPVKAGQAFGPEDGNDRACESSDGSADGYDACENAQRQGLGYAWEIGHLTQGQYTLDSWRIFCRDELLGRADDWNGKGRNGDFQPEWMRVLPRDKELRAYLRWMWMREGWDWDPLTGERQVLGQDMIEAVNDGRVGWDTSGILVILEPKGAATAIAPSSSEGR